MIGFALCHGWSFDASALASLQAALENHFPQAAWALFDLGFTGQAHTPPLEPDRQWIALGHSYGFAWLMQQPVPWQAAVSINGFTRFCRRPGHPEGTPVRLLDAMRERLAREPRATVQEFYRRCGALEAAPTHLDPLQLHDHLTRLRDLDQTPPLCPTLAFATQDDTIVPLALSRACFERTGCAFYEVPGDHMHLLREPVPCVDAVVRLLENLHG